MVIGLNLCPFARRVIETNSIRYAVSLVENPGELLDALEAEILHLVSTPALETTMLIHPRTLGDFLDYNDFLDLVDQRVEELGQQGIVQIASFHPQYRFAGTAADDVENYTNRSPYPMLHLLREDSISAVADDPDALLEIPRRNAVTLRNLGREAILAMLRGIQGKPDQTKP